MGWRKYRYVLEMCIAYYTVKNLVESHIFILHTGIDLVITCYRIGSSLFLGMEISQRMLKDFE